eukprot:scaffold14183_cov55-Phaeocystis_antarctica.AAC.3
MVHGVLGLRVGARLVNGDEPRWLARLGYRLGGCIVEQGRPGLGLVTELLEDLPTGLMGVARDLGLVKGMNRCQGDEQKYRRDRTGGASSPDVCQGYSLGLGLARVP